MDQSYEALIESDRVSAQTRRVLQLRGIADNWDYKSSIFSDDQFATLRSLASHVIPQSGSDYDKIDLAARLDHQLASGRGDGWRYAALPPDIEAYSVALTLLDDLAGKLNHASFCELIPPAQDDLLTSIADGSILSEALDLQHWFEDFRAALTGIYVSHPNTLARMQYSGIADDPRGFVQIGINQIEPWEPTK